MIEDKTENKFMIVRSEYRGRRKKVMNKDLSKAEAEQMMLNYHNTYNYYFTIVEQLIP